jgi:hypothetical protein
MYVSILGSAAGASNIYVSINGGGAAALGGCGAAGGGVNGFFIVPPGQTYNVTNTGSAFSSYNWFEFSG